MCQWLLFSMDFYDLDYSLWKEAIRSEFIRRGDEVVEIFYENELEA